MIGAIFWPIRVPCQAQYLDAVQLALEGIDEAKRIVDRTKGLRLVTNADEMEQAHNEGKIGVLLGIEGGHSLGSSVAVLRMFYSLGSRFISLTSVECSNPWITAHTTKEPLFEEAAPSSMTEFGKVSHWEKEKFLIVQGRNSNYFPDDTIGKWKFRWPREMLRLLLNSLTISFHFHPHLPPFVAQY